MVLAAARCGPPVEVLCHAEVVRLAKAVERVPAPAVAARILDYSLLSGHDSFASAASA